MKLPDGPQEHPIPYEGGVPPMMGKLFPHELEDTTRDPYIPNKIP